MFYNMTKKREGNDNWYMLPPEERGRMMREHGITGRPYLEVLSEYTTGGVGLDDWEWGVTIFSNDDIQFKKIVYDMRFEEASARYGILQRFLCRNVNCEARFDEVFA